MAVLVGKSATNHSTFVGFFFAKTYLHDIWIVWMHAFKHILSDWSKMILMKTDSGTWHGKNKKTIYIPRFSFLFLQDLYYNVHLFGDLLKRVPPAISGHEPIAFRNHIRMVQTLHECWRCSFELDVVLSYSHQIRSKSGQSGKTRFFENYQVFFDYAPITRYLFFNPKNLGYSTP